MIRLKIGLIDVDGHNYPNLALMKISAWHKAHGDTVEWWWGFGHYDRVYMSKVFDETYTPDMHFWGDDCPYKCDAYEAWNRRVGERKEGADNG